MASAASNTVLGHYQISVQKIKNGPFKDEIKISSDDGQATIIINKAQAQSLIDVLSAAIR